MPDLHVEDLVVEYGGSDNVIRPLDGFSLDAPGGSLVILLGPSGCGKTTLLTCLGGMLTPTTGRIRFGETAVERLSGAALTQYRRHSVGFVFQAFQLIPSLSALENVMLPLRSAGVPKGEARRRAMDGLDRVEMGHRVSHRPGDMSGGQQQRVAIARALALGPDLLLADEPTAHLDFRQVEEVLKLIRSLAAGGRVVVVSTHDSRLVPLADQVVEMVPNFLLGDRPPQEINLEDGETLFRQGEMGELVYVIESGSVDVLRELEDGSTELRVTLGPGDYVGEMAPFFGLPRSATVRANAPSRVVGYTPRSFRERMGTLPATLGAAVDLALGPPP